MLIIHNHSMVRYDCSTNELIDYHLLEAFHFHIGSPRPLIIYTRQIMLNILYFFL